MAVGCKCDAPVAPAVSKPTAPAAAPKPAAPAAPKPSAPTAAPAVSKPAATPAPSAPAAPAASSASNLSITDVRKALAAKVNAHREAIKAKLEEYNVANVTTLPEEKYAEFHSFLMALD